MNLESFDSMLVIISELIKLSGQQSNCMLIVQLKSGLSVETHSIIPMWRLAVNRQKQPGSHSLQICMIKGQSFTVDTIDICVVSICQYLNALWIYIFRLVRIKDFYVWSVLKHSCFGPTPGSLSRCAICTGTGRAPFVFQHHASMPTKWLTWPASICTLNQPSSCQTSSSSSELKLLRSQHK